MIDPVIAARRWIGTPYVHQASAQGVGCDCLGLIRGIWRARYGAEPVIPPAYGPDWGEAGRDEVLWDAAREWLIPRPLGARGPGDVILFRMRDGAIAKHLGVLSAVGDSPAFVHAYSGHGVIESPLSVPWARRVVAVFSWPEGDA